ncbi:hypothetical protein F1188_15920 [Roseospira marina]|uniref:RNA polymerase sigma-70 region 2 domain-containing protein n=1 Tax=Roseospira marina TaxID=140057 RepID=A0A5M6I9J7_9PROT|nr:sigma factor [Roseospira marina]KAA5604348.1 hypothetical protein F1188_15920 [Roseospira marina]MBB4315468.1 RNA polymerase sigma factor (sigma-70 family) [Roseospira marina]MBB5088386.1 RNA polymerase sigma factor (sigma-70 family) [Roseospira marina]
MKAKITEDPLDPKAVEHLVNTLAWRVSRRMTAAGARLVESADIRQEIWIAWTRARDSYDPTSKVPFGAYFWRGAMRHMNQWCRQMEQTDVKIFGLSLDDQLTDDASLHEVVEDTSVVSAEENVRLSERRSRVLAKLSPLARRFLELLESPPPELYAEIQALQDRMAWARERKVRGGRGSTTTRVTTAFVADVMGLDRMTRRTVYRELESWKSR